MATELENPVVVEFPLRGERWVAVHTPGDKIPSHGVDMLGQRYAFQLMDSPELMTAKGVPCAFRAYEVLRDGTWERVENGIPRSTDRIRSVG